MTIMNRKQCCANCQYWDGERKVSSFKDRAETRSLSDKGICRNRKATNANGRAWQAEYACNDRLFEKWDQLQ